MGDRLRLAVGVMGNAACLLLFTAPILTFSRVIKNKSTQGFSCFPYTIALFNCFIYTWYGLPIVSYRWENFPLVTINGLGILLEICFVLIYLWHATPKNKVRAVGVLVPVMVVFCITAVVSAFVFHTHHHRKVFVGTVGFVASVLMYGSPLVVVKKVIQTKSVEFMPFYLSLFSFIASTLWMIYGLLSHDMFIATPNIVATPLGILQLLVYCKYRKRGVMEEPNKWDVEQNDEKTKQQQTVTEISDKS